jgi:P27 family predicted phage terminase small subunit
VKTEGGNIIQNPFLAIANKCLFQMAQIESEFGMTPSSRSRIRATVMPEMRDPFEDYLNNDKGSA